MKTTWVWIVLAASIALNAFFVGGYVHAAREADRSRSPSGARQLVAERLGLDDAQRRALREAREAATREAQSIYREGRAVRDAYWDEMAKPTPDPAVLDRLTAEAAANRERLSAALTVRLTEFLDSLDPEQRESFVEIVRNRRLLGGRFLMDGERSPGR